MWGAAWTAGGQRLRVLGPAAPRLLAPEGRLFTPPPTASPAHRHFLALESPAQQQHKLEYLKKFRATREAQLKGRLCITPLTMPLQLDHWQLSYFPN